MFCSQKLANLSKMSKTKFKILKIRFDMIDLVNRNILSVLALCYDYWQLYYLFPFIFQMSTDKMSLLDYLPQQQKMRVVELIKRLGEVTEQKNKYVSLFSQKKDQFDELSRKYNEMKEKYDEMSIVYNKLKDENNYYKQQMHQSFSIISQVRANFKENKEKKSNTKVSIDKQEEEDSEELDEQQQQTVEKQEISNYPPKQIKKNQLEKYRPQLKSSNANNSLLNLSSSYISQTNPNTSSKSKQVESLRKEVRALQENKKKEEAKAKQFEEKNRLVEEIKHRYKSNHGSSQKKPIERIDITDTFQQQQSSEPSKPNTTKSVTKRQEMIVPQSQKRIKKQIQQKEIKPNYTSAKASSKTNIVTIDDYGDVLDMINTYNL